VTSPTTPPPTATSSDFRSAPARTSFRVSNSTVARFFAASASSNKCTTGAAPLAKLPANAFPTARHTFGELTTCTLENLPSFAISRPALRSNPAAHTTPYLPALALTQTVRTFARIFAFFISRNSLSPQCITIPHGLEGAPSFAPYAKGGLLRSDASTPLLFSYSPCPLCSFLCDLCVTVLLSFFPSFLLSFFPSFLLSFFPSFLLSFFPSFLLFSKLTTEN